MKTYYRNYYRCPNCSYAWEDEWDCEMDLFKCETCGKVLDIEDSVEENDMLICSECNEKED